MGEVAGVGVFGSAGEVAAGPIDKLAIVGLGTVTFVRDLLTQG